MGYIGNAPYQGVITGGNIVDGTVEEADIKNDAVTTQKIEDANVTEGKLADGAVTTAKIADDAVTDAKLNSTKLDGIETGATADQTGAEIKTAYESQSNTNAYTDAEKTKLSGIETGATADQSASEIKTSYESNSNTNAFTDAEKTKLSGIETSADVTDTTNVVAALTAGSDISIAADGTIAYTGASDLVSDTSPQLGGVLDTNGNNIEFGDSTGAEVERLKFGASDDLQIYHDGTDSIISEGTTSSDLYIKASNLRLTNSTGTSSTGRYLVAVDGGEVKLFHNNTEKLKTTSTGVSILSSDLLINRITSPNDYTEIKKTTGGSNLAITSQESVYINLDSNNNQTNRSFFVNKDTSVPGSGTTLFRVEENGNATITGTCTATAFSGDGSGLTNVDAGTVKQIVSTTKKDSYQTSSSGWIDVPSLSLSITTTGGKIYGVVSVHLDASSGNGIAGFRILRNGSATGNSVGNGGISGGWNTFGTGSDAQQFTPNFLDTVSAGTYTYKVQINRGSCSNVSCNRFSGNSSTLGNSIIAASTITLMEVS